VIRIHPICKEGPIKISHKRIVTTNAVVAQYILLVDDELDIVVRLSTFFEAVRPFFNNIEKMRHYELTSIKGEK
jgi:hypothetical protein